MTSLRSRLSGSVSEVRVDDAGITAHSRREVVLDVLVEGRRVFSFWLHRDGIRDDDGDWVVTWPTALRQHLDGTGQLSVVVHESGEVVFDEQVELGSGTGGLEVVNHDGQPMALDKSLRLVQTFDTRSAQHVQPLIDAIDEVLTALNAAGIEGFLAYGTLLGAVRDSHLIGHDSDADLGYVSHLDHPVDVIRESFRLQRALVGLGYRITRYSALAFKIHVVESDGVERGLDVFGGFLMDGVLNLMGEIREPFRREWVFPLGTAVLEGREFAVPADTDRFLQATYGPSWRVPDPAYQFTTPESTHRRFDGWFRGIRVGRPRWDRIYSRQRPVPEPSDFVSWVAGREPHARTVVDLGCGRGADALWLADQGYSVVGLDVQPRSFLSAQEQEQADGGVRDVEFWTYNVLEMRQVLAVSALVARRPGPRVLMSRHLVGVIGRRARANLWRSAEMMLAGGDGQLHLEFCVHRGSDNYAGVNKVRPIKARVVIQELKARGATVVHRDTFPVPGPDGAPDRGASRVCRLVVEWKR